MRRFPATLILPLVIAGALQAGEPGRDDLCRSLTSLHTRVYALDNMLIRPYETSPRDDVAEWRALMAAITQYVQGPKGFREGEEMMATLNAASEQLIKERNRAWETAVRKSLRQSPPTGLSRLDRTKIDFARLDLSGVIEADSALQFTNRTVAGIPDKAQKLADAWLQTQAHKDALAVVKLLGLTLQLTLEKFHNDLAALKKARTG